MKAFIKKLYDQLTNEAAKTAYLNAGCLPCKAVMNYKGQYLSFENYELFPCPSVLFQYTLNRINDNEGVLEATITLHLCYERVLDASSLSIDLDKALEYHVFNDVTYDLIKNLQTEDTGKLSFESEDQQKMEAIVSVHLMTFTASYNGRLNKLKDYEYKENTASQVESGIYKKLKRVSLNDEDGDNTVDYGFDT